MIPALSIRQPWAWAITTLGKDVENRTWRRSYRGPVLIHAGAGVKAADVEAFLATVADSAELQARLAAAGGLQLDELRQEAGGIVGAAEITGCVRTSSSPWFFGPYGFTLAGAKPLPFRACKGALGLFEPALPGDELQALAGLAGIPDRFVTPPLFAGLQSWPQARQEPTGRRKAAEVEPVADLFSTSTLGA